MSDMNFLCFFFVFCYAFHLIRLHYSEWSLRYHMINWLHRDKINLTSNKYALVKPKYVVCNLYWSVQYISNANVVLIQYKDFLFTNGNFNYEDKTVVQLFYGNPYTGKTAIIMVNWGKICCVRYVCGSVSKCRSVARSYGHYTPEYNLIKYNSIQYDNYGVIALTRLWTQNLMAQQIN